MKISTSLAYLLVLTGLIITRHDKPEKDFMVEPAEFPSVVQLNLKDATGIVQMEATFIRKDWLLTAAHGLSSVYENQTIQLLDTTCTIKRIVMHPDFEGLEHDIALIQIDQEIAEVSPTPVYRDSNELHQPILLIGRGWSGTGTTGPITDDQQLRQATNLIDSVSMPWLKFRFDEPGHPNATLLEGISGPGDSGGPALINIDGERFLAGISSHQLNQEIGVQEGHYGVIEYYTRVSSYLDWMDQVLREAPRTQEISLNSENAWGFPNTEIGEKATELMHAIASKRITDEMMSSVFYESFRTSFDLKGFVQSIANNLQDPKLLEFKKARKNILTFVLSSEGRRYFFQIEADKRDDYKVGGLIFKELKP